jgi:superfamily II DNA or RNA helicase
MQSITIDLKKSAPRDDRPYGYQDEAIAKLDEYFALGQSVPAKRKSGVIVMPTGSGKTFTSVSWLLDKAAGNGYQIIWLVHQQELVAQAYETIRSMSPILKNYSLDKISIVPVSSRHYSISQAGSADIIVGCIQSFASRKGLKYLDFITKGKGRKKLVVVIDEAHHASSDSYQLVLKRFEQFNSNMVLLGMTATPTRMIEAQKRRFQNLFGIIDNVKNGVGTPQGFIYEVTLKELLKSGSLANPIYRKVETEIDGEVEFEFTDIDRKYLEQFGELSEQVKDKVAKSSLRNRIIVDEYIKNRDKYGKTIIFAVNQLHCKTLQKAFDDAGISGDQCRYAISSEKEQADKNIAAFKNDEFPILINVQMLTEGFDSPNIQTCFLTRFTQSESLKMQMAGRALRGKRAKGTEVAYIVDFHDMWDGIESDWGGIIDGGEQATCPHCESSWNVDENIDATVNGICPFCGASIKIERPPIEDEDKEAGAYIPLEVFFRVYSAMRDNLRHHTHKDVVPAGWYTIPDDEGNEQTVLVYDHQLYGYKQLEEDMAKHGRLANQAKYYIDGPAYFANAAEANGQMQEEWPPDEAELELLIEYANNSGQMPLFYTFKQRDALDQYQVAEELGEQNFSGNYLEQSRKANDWLLAKRSDTPILRDLYKNPDDFIRAVQNAMGGLDGPDDPNAAVIEYSDERGVYEIKPGIYDLNELRDEVIGEVQKAGVTDKDGKPVFDNAIRPAVVWSRRVMKSYYGACYKRETIDGTGFFIRINKIMSSPQAPRETLKFLIYHELLHANGYWPHNVLFRDTEWKYPKSDEHNSFLDSLKLRFKIVDNGLPMYDMYDKEPEILKPLSAKAEKKGADRVDKGAPSKRHIAFTSQGTYQIIDSADADASGYIYSAPIPEHIENSFMLFAYNDGRIAKVSLRGYRFDSRRSTFKNAYSAHAPLVWVELCESDGEIAVFSSINKVVVFDTRLINPVDSTTSRGVIVQKSKKGSVVAKVARLGEAGLNDVDYYRCSNIPAIGVYLKKRREAVEDILTSI